ncbi:MAG: DUF433 domain-containing protein [Planctomycetota bacterium]
MELQATTPNYTLQEAAMFVRLPQSTLLYWTRGRKGTPPVIRTKKLLSLVNLVEIHMVSMFRAQHGVSLQRVRRAIARLAREHPQEKHPLATKRFWTDGREILTQRVGGDLVSLNVPGQMTFGAAIELYARRVEWNAGVPVRLYPWTVNRIADVASERRSVVVDPRVAFGRSVIAGTRVTTKAIKELWDLGVPIDEIAEEFDVTTIRVQDAVRLEEARPARRAG